jgi:hypothetical protein
MPMINSVNINWAIPNIVEGNSAILLLITGKRIMVITKASPAFAKMGMTLALKKGSI